MDIPLFDHAPVEATTHEPPDIASGRAGSPRLRYPTFGIVGWQNAGKTTLIEALLSEFATRGLRVSTIKHAHHPVEVDAPGKDSYRHRAAGAIEVILASSGRWVLMTELRDEPEPTLEQLVGRLGPCALVLVEGFKEASHPKLEIIRNAHPRGRIADQVPNTLAIATDDPVLAGSHPVLALNDVPAIADFILLHAPGGIAPGYVRPDLVPSLTR